MYEDLCPLSFQCCMFSVKANEDMILIGIEYLIIRLVFRLFLNRPKVQFDPLKITGF